MCDKTDCPHLFFGGERAKLKSIMNKETVFVLIGIMIGLWTGFGIVLVGSYVHKDDFRPKQYCVTEKRIDVCFDTKYQAWKYMDGLEEISYSQNS